MTPNSEIEAHNAWLRSLSSLDPSSFPFSPIPPPHAEDAFCSLALIRTGNLTKFPTWYLLNVSDQVAMTNLPANCFLIGKVMDGKSVRVIFDLGLRNRSEHHKSYYQQLGDKWGGTFTSGAARILEKNGIPLDTIHAVFLGHTHFDHVGNLACFPDTTSLVLGPGSDSSCVSLAKELDVPESALENRSVQVLNRKDFTWRTVGCLDGLDYFGDGSFWLLDTPGHNITALVRTSTDPPVYHVLASDAAHSQKLLRPKDYPTCRAGLFPSPTDPDYLTSMHDDLEQAYISISKLSRMDDEDNINVFLSHDSSMDVMYPPGEFTRIDGGWEEIKRLKNRDRSVTTPQEHLH